MLFVRAGGVGIVRCDETEPVWRDLRGLVRISLAMGSPPSPVRTLPGQPDQNSSAEARSSRDYGSGDNETEEQPEPAHEVAALQLRAKVPPRKRSKAQEADQEARERGDILYRCSA
ncbi:MAG: hypothetical protein ABIR58_01090 [Gemmatimonadaceae bacterium]